MLTNAEYVCSFCRPLFHKNNQPNDHIISCFACRFCDKILESKIHFTQHLENIHDMARKPILFKELQDERNELWFFLDDVVVSKDEPKTMVIKHFHPLS
ncbi:Hypothetical protein CINCED_3A024159 [Cinara cedri]|nr:Hypothetical protein CINCED_3A024159 [Cinara cedri]